MAVVHVITCTLSSRKSQSCAPELNVNVNVSMYTTHTHACGAISRIHCTMLMMYRSPMLGERDGAVLGDPACGAAAGQPVVNASFSTELVRRSVRSWRCHDTLHDAEAYGVRSCKRSGLWMRRRTSSMRAPGPATSTHGHAGSSKPRPLCQCAPARSCTPSLYAWKRHS
jgi:hypothetical protein